MFFPNSPYQPGPIFFKTPRKCLVFGIIEEASSKMEIYLLDESVVIKKGADCVISLVHDHLEKRADTSTPLVLHADNCGWVVIVLANPNFYLEPWHVSPTFQWQCEYESETNLHKLNIVEDKTRTTLWYHIVCGEWLLEETHQLLSTFSSLDIQSLLQTAALDTSKGGTDALK